MSMAFGSPTGSSTGVGRIGSSFGAGTPGVRGCLAMLSVRRVRREYPCDALLKSRQMASVWNRHPAHGAVRVALRKPVVVHYHAVIEQRLTPRVGSGHGHNSRRVPLPMHRGPVQRHPYCVFHTSPKRFRTALAFPDQSLQISQCGHGRPRQPFELRALSSPLPCAVLQVLSHQYRYSLGSLLSLVSPPDSKPAKQRTGVLGFPLVCVNLGRRFERLARGTLWTANCRNLDKSAIGTRATLRSRWG